jgi:uncharacterized protein (DUF952 family)
VREIYLEPGEYVDIECFYGKESNENYRAYLTNKHLVLRRKKHWHYFPLENIVNLNYKERKLLFPLLMGGIVVPFSLLLIFRNIFHSWTVLILLFAGLLSFYFGWAGRKSLTITTIIKDYDIFVDEENPNLHKFLDLVRIYIKLAKLENEIKNNKLILIIVDQKKYQESKISLILNTDSIIKKGYETGFTFYQKQLVSNEILNYKDIPCLLLLNPDLLPNELVEINTENNDNTFIKIHGPIPIAAIERVEDFTRLK